MKTLKIHNTLGNNLEEFKPIDPLNVRVYACGPTVYNYAHIGNARMAVVNDLLIRFLKTLYPKVTYVSNITDIDDKIIAASQENKISIKELTEKYTKIYNEDMSVLGVNQPDIQPKATDYIKEMINLIEKLIKNNFAYEKDGHVLLPFDIHSGGADLIFPHHENEIAQTCAAHKSNDDLKSFSKYWFHNGFVNVEGEKMSKSIGNIKLVHDLVKEYKGEVLRLTLLSAHYRQPLNWTRDIIKQNSTMLDRLYRTLKDLEKIDAYAEKNEIEERIINGLYDDLNTPKVIAELNMLTNGINNADVKTKQKGAIINFHI